MTEERSECAGILEIVLVKLVVCRQELQGAERLAGSALERYALAELGERLSFVTGLCPAVAEGQVASVAQPVAPGASWWRGAQLQQQQLSLGGMVQPVQQAGGVPLGGVMEKKVLQYVKDNTPCPRKQILETFGSSVSSVVTQLSRREFVKVEGTRGRSTVTFISDLGLPRSSALGVSRAATIEAVDGLLRRAKPNDELATSLITSTKLSEKAVRKIMREHAERGWVVKSKRRGYWRVLPKFFC